jgi:hypothetical protein
MTCTRCNSDVDPGRAEFLRETGRPVVCMTCSGEQAKVCFISYSHKTAGELVVVGTDPEAIRRAERAYRRAR